MATRFHPALFTADTLQQMQESNWFIRLTGEEHEAFATVQAALRRIADEDLATETRQED